ncbi:MAG: type II toxin-antitoxin system RelE/ParE family toxin [Acetobacteraceae bacterium]|nr:type II toxin-antitoxin system RelE/ParE family toxin [Acetobacteraceae bacterium]
MALILTRSAVKDLQALPKREAAQVAARLQAIAAAPTDRHPGVIALHGEPAGRFRVRQGDWRAVFVIQGGDVVVVKIAHRKEVYD